MIKTLNSILWINSKVLSNKSIILQIPLDILVDNLVTTTLTKSFVNGKYAEVFVNQTLYLY